MMREMACSRHLLAVFLYFLFGYQAPLEQAMLSGYRWSRAH